MSYWSWEMVLWAFRLVVALWGLGLFLWGAGNWMWIDIQRQGGALKLDDPGYLHEWTSHYMLIGIGILLIQHVVSQLAFHFVEIQNKIYRPEDSEGEDVRQLQTGQKKVVG